MYPACSEAPMKKWPDELNHDSQEHRDFSSFKPFLLAGQLRLHTPLPSRAGHPADGAALSKLLLKDSSRENLGQPPWLGWGMKRTLRFKGRGEGRGESASPQRLKIIQLCRLLPPMSLGPEKGRGKKRVGSLHQS